MPRGKGVRPKHGKERLFRRGAQTRTRGARAPRNIDLQSVRPAPKAFGAESFKESGQDVRWAHRQDAYVPKRKRLDRNFGTYGSTSLRVRNISPWGYGGGNGARRTTPGSRRGWKR